MQSKLAPYHTFIYIVIITMLWKMFRLEMQFDGERGRFQHFSSSYVSEFPCYRMMLEKVPTTTTSAAIQSPSVFKRGLFLCFSFLLLYILLWKNIKLLNVQKLKLLLIVLFLVMRQVMYISDLYLYLILLYKVHL